MLIIWEMKTAPLSWPKTSLIICFIAWKLLLFIVAFASPGVGYDTSTTLLLRNGESSSAPNFLSSRLCTKFVRWDAIYYTQIAKRGYLFEQEWAFGWGFTALLALAGKGLSSTGLVEDFHAEALAGLITAHLGHMLSTLILYQLSLFVFQSKLGAQGSKIALISAYLHIITPAGIFLSAPYAESLFSFLQFSGFYFYAKSKVTTRTEWRDVNVLTSGILIGLASTARSNGILTGLLFALDAVKGAFIFFRFDRSLAMLRNVVISVLAGLFVASGILLPQWLAYKEYCTGDYRTRRVWCTKAVPSIYTWVQSHYWNVGFLRYWTLSNIPLFFLATPMMAIMAYSARWAFSETSKSRKTERIASEGVSPTYDVPRNPDLRLLLPHFALPQIALASLALAVYHVQIITRLSSGYPVWYWWLASTMLTNQENNNYKTRSSIPMVVSRGMVLYAIIQGGLFASFLPPA